MEADIDKLQIEIEANSKGAESTIDRLTASLQRLQRAVGNHSALKQTAQQVQNIGKAPSLSKLERELAKVEKQAVRDGDALLALQRRLDDLSQFRGVGNKLTVADTEQKIRETESQIQKLSAAVDQADAKIRTLRQSIQGATAGTGAPLAKATQQIKSAAPAMENVSRATQSVKSNLDAAGTSADRFGRTMKKATSSGSGGMKYLARSIKGMATSFVLFGLMFSASQAISDSLGRMAVENETVNKTLSEIKSSLQYVSDALAAVIYPIVQALAPIIVTILDALAGILNVIARIIAFLTGSDSVIQAQKQWVDYAEGVDGATGSMNDATSAAKKLYRALLPIDELNILADNSGGGSGGLGGLRFEETSVDSVNIPELIASPKWTPNPIPAPTFAPLVLPAWAKSSVDSPAWKPDPIPAPAFEALQLPDVLLSPLPIPAWEENPVVAPNLSLAPVLDGLAEMKAAFAEAWGSIKVTVSDGVTSVGATLSQFAANTAATLERWGETAKVNFASVMNYLQAVTVPALSNAASNFAQFVQNTAGNVRAWGENVAANVQATLAYIPEAVASGLSAAAQSIATWVNGTSANIVDWAKNLVTNAGQAAQGFYKNIVSGLSAAWESFKSAMKAMGEAVSGWWSANKSWAAPLAAGVAITGLTVGAVVLSGGSAVAAIPALAALKSGGVITEPTVALMGEYPNARVNPEIVAPQNLMYEIVRDAQDNTDIINAIFTMGQQIINAINNNGGDVYLDGNKVGTVVTASQNRQNRVYGKTLQRV